jgi:hypothetical protein
VRALVRALHRASVPLVAYYAVTLVLPVANGAAQSGTAFLRHALTVLVFPLAAVALGGAVCAFYARFVVPARVKR